MIRRITTISIVALLASCATEERFEMLIGSWKGLHIDKFTRAYGLPSKIIRGGGGEDVYVYDERGRKCRIFWTVDQEKIMRKFTHEGSDCKQEANII